MGLNKHWYSIVADHRDSVRNRERSLTARLAEKALRRNLDYDWSDAG